MIWTQEKPTADGWYWAQNSNFDETFMVFVEKVENYTHVWNPLRLKESSPNAFDWWYGPLTYPYRLTPKSK